MGDKGRIHVEHERTMRTTSLLRRDVKVDGQWLEPWEEEEELLVRKYIGPVATVGLEGGLTVNTGNFESAKINVVCHVPCYIEEIDEVSKFLADHVVRRIDEDLEALIGARAERDKVMRIQDASAQDPFRPQKKIFSGPKLISNAEVNKGKDDVNAEVAQWESPVEDGHSPLF